MSLTWQEKKVYWLILALALASGAQIADRVRRKWRPEREIGEPRAIGARTLVTAG